MKKGRITGLKTPPDEALAAEYGVPGLSACPVVKAGQVFRAQSFSSWRRRMRNPNATTRR